MRMKWMRNPCRSCYRRYGRCNWENCPKWQEWFFDAWEDFHRTAWEAVERQEQKRKDKIHVILPHEDPCRGCKCAQWCDTPCTKRLIWWDWAMGRTRKRLGVTG